MLARRNPDHCSCGTPASRAASSLLATITHSSRSRGISCKSGCRFLPEFGDAQAEASARAQYAQLYPGRAVIQLNIDAIAAGGGGIHCTTQQPA